MKDKPRRRRTRMSDKDLKAIHITNFLKEIQVFVEKNGDKQLAAVVRSWLKARKDRDKIRYFKMICEIIRK